MPKNKRPAPRKSSTPPEEKEEFLSQQLCSLALELAEQEDSATEAETLSENGHEFRRLLQRYLNQNKDEVLYGAVELARDEDVGAYQLLRSSIEEAAATLLQRRDDAPTMEINAFAIPLFVHSRGGLREADGFQDQDAYELLLDSIRSAGLEAPKAKLVLVQHAYDLAECERISYGQLHAMVREAAASLGGKKLAEAPALQRSIAGWSATAFGADDEAVELRFLLGFALKRADDPFYLLPADEAGQDAWFAERMERYRAWTVQAAPLVQRCLAQGRDDLQLNFLYQDLFFGALQQGRAEHATLGMMAELGAALRAHGGPARAVVQATDEQGEMVLRVQLYGEDALLASHDRPFDVGDDLEVEVDDVRDALSTLGVHELIVELTAP